MRWLAVLLLVGICSCAGSSEYRQGQELLEIGQYDRAVEAYEAAVAQAPDNTRYQIALAEAQAAAADHHLAQADQLLEQHLASKAKEELLQSLKYAPAHPQANSKMVEVKLAIDQCASLVARAQVALDQSDWLEAATLLERAYQLDRAHAGLAAMRRQAIDAVVAESLDAAQASIDAQDFGQAIQAAERVLVFSKDHPQAQHLHKLALDRQESQALAAEARALFDQQDNTTALVVFRQAVKLWPENVALQQELVSMRQRVVERLAGQGEVELSQGHYAAAIKAFDQALAVTPKNADVLDRKARAKQEWADARLEDARRLADEKSWEAAWVTGLEAMCLSPSVASEATSVCHQAELQIRERINYSLSILPVRKTQAVAEPLQRVCSVLLEHVNDYKADHVHLVERTNLRDLIAEQDLSLADITDRTKLDSLEQNLEGVDVFCFVALSIETETVRQKVRDATTRYNAGRKSVRNPEYDKAESEVQRTQMKLAQVQARRPPVVASHDPSSPESQLAAVAESLHRQRVHSATAEYHSALAKRSSTPQQIQVDQWRDHTYPVYQRSRTATARVSLRLVETATGRILWSENDTRAEVIDTGEEVDADPQHGVTVKHANLRTSSALEKLALDKLDTVLVATARELLRQRSQAYLDDARKAAGQRATTSFVWYLFDVAATADRDTTREVVRLLAGNRFGDELLAAFEQAVIDRLDMRFPEPVESTTTARLTDEPKDSQQQKTRTTPPAEPPAFHGTVSKDDDRYPRSVSTLDGIVVRMIDADDHPLDADIEVEVGHSGRKYEDQRVGSVINGYGLSGRRYQLRIRRIEYDEETLHFTVVPLGSTP